MSAPVSHLRAIGYALAGFTFWVLTDTCIKLAGGMAVPSYEIVGFLGLTQFTTIAFLAWVRGETEKLRPQRPGRQLVRCIVVLGSNFANAIALNHLPLTTFYVIVFTAPMVIALLAAVFLREHLGWQKILAIVVGFGGVVYAVNPGASASTSDWIGYVAITFSVITFAINMTWLRVMTQTESLHSLVFVSGLVCAAAGFAPMLWHFEPLTASTFAVLITAGIFNMLGNLGNFKALRHAAAATVSQFHYSQIIVGAAMGYIIWHDVPTTHLAVGAAIIVASGLYIAAHSEKTGKLPPERML